MAYTFTLLAPNSISGFVFQNSATGNSYTSDGNGYFKSVASVDVNSALSMGCELIGAADAANNLNATTDPTPVNDNTQDYTIGSTWINKTLGRVWIATGVATSSAVWRLSNQPLSDFRNMIDGGDFTINPWQRGTTFSSGVASSLTYTADRFFVQGGTSSGIAVYQSSISSIAGFQYGLTFQRQSSNSSLQPIFLGQVIESADCYRAQGQQVTLSFWAQAGSSFSAATSSMTVLLNEGFGSNQSASSMMNSSWTTFSSIINSSQVITSSMTRYQFTTSVSSGATQLGIQLGYTPVGSSAGVSDLIIFAGIQLEIGGCASEFEHRDISYEIETAQRYFWRINEPAAGSVVCPGANNTVSSQTFFLNNPVYMRANPTVTTSSGTFAIQSGSSTSSCTISGSSGTHTNYALTIAGSATGAISSGATNLVGGSSGLGFIAASADF